MLKNKKRIEQIQQRLENSFKPEALKITDDSHLHSGHEGAKTGMGHFTVEITARVFANKSKVQQHRMIYACLKDLFKTDIHALRILSKSN